MSLSSNKRELLKVHFKDASAVLADVVSGNKKEFNGELLYICALKD
jgi:hypothetical protein